VSNHRFVTTLGRPYFCFKCEGVGDASTLPAFGLASVTLEFRVNALPAALADADEIHPIFAFVADSPLQDPIFMVGVTPSGRVSAASKSNDVWATAAGTIADTGVWNTLSVFYDGGTGDWAVTLNGHPYAQLDPAPEYLVPNAGYGTRILFFNNKDGIGAAGVSLRAATAGFVGTYSNVYTWDFSAGSGGTIAAVKSSTGTDELPSDGTMEAGYIDPLITAPYGIVPTGSPTGDYAWGLATDYTAVPRPTTRYTQVAA
jgi:hypothetical protein